MAPSYGNGEAEEVVGVAFEGKLPEGVRISTECRIDNPDPAEMSSKIEDSLDNSLKRLKLEWVDFLLLHNQIISDDKVDRYNGIPFGVFMEVIVPIFENLVEKDRIGHWGMTGIGVPSEILKVFYANPAPKVIQIVTNVLDSPGSLKRFNEPAIPRELINKANISGVS